MRLILLDSGPLGELVHPRASHELRVWAGRNRTEGSGLVVPEVCDYEVRRELIRLELSASLARLDALCESLLYAPVSTAILRRSASLWAEARRQGRQTAANLALDVDVILAATAQTLMEDGHDVIVATTNVNHLGRFVAAAHWREIDPV